MRKLPKEDLGLIPISMLKLIAGEKHRNPELTSVYLQTTQGETVQVDCGELYEFYSNLTAGGLYEFN